MLPLSRHSMNAFGKLKHVRCLRRQLSSSSHHDSKNDLSVVLRQIKALSIGSWAGMLGSLAGMGGGFVMIPMMTAATHRIGYRRLFSGLGLSQHQAHGTSLFAVGSTGLFGALAYGIRVETEDEDNKEIHNNKERIHNNNNNTNISKQQGLVELDVAIALTATAMITASFGANAASRLSERALKKLLGGFMLFVAPLVPGKKYITSFFGNDVDADTTSEHHIKSQADLLDNRREETSSSSMENLLPASFIGMFSGFLAGLFGVGGGAIVVPSLVLSTDMSHHAALGTSLCAMVLPAMVGVWTHAKRGNVAWRVAPALAVGSAIGAYVGGKEVGLNLEEDVLRGGFGVLMLVLGARTWKTAG